MMSENLGCHNSISCLIIAYKNLELAHEYTGERRWKDAQESIIWAKSHVYEIERGEKAIVDSQAEEHIESLIDTFLKIEDKLSEYLEKSPESRMDIAKTMISIDMAQKAILEKAPGIIKSACQCTLGNRIIGENNAQ